MSLSSRAAEPREEAFLRVSGGGSHGRTAGRGRCLHGAHQDSTGPCNASMSILPLSDRRVGRDTFDQPQEDQRWQGS
jgi:hypothetical protein